jgi:hypothetical protein
MGVGTERACKKRQLSRAVHTCGQLQMKRCCGSESTAAEQSERRRHPSDPAPQLAGKLPSPAARGRCPERLQAQVRGPIYIDMNMYGIVR